MNDRTRSSAAAALGKANARRQVLWLYPIQHLPSVHLRHCDVKYKHNGPNIVAVGGPFRPSGTSVVLFTALCNVMRAKSLMSSSSITTIFLLS